MYLERWQFWKRGALAISPRWQLIIGALAILGAGLGCVAPSWAPAPAVSPIPSPTASPIPTQSEAAIDLEKAPPPTPGRSLRETVSALQSLNVRKGPSETTPSLSVLYHGDPVLLTGQCLPGWAQIKHRVDGRLVLAWVNARYITGDLCKRVEE